MSRDRFVTPDTKRIEISDGDWLLVKKGLTAGDQRKQDALAVTPTAVGNRVVDVIDWSIYEFLRTDLWLVDWSLHRPDARGISQPVKKSVAALQALEPEEFDEINNAVYAHIREWLESKKGKRTKEGTASPDDNASPTSVS